MRPPNWIEICNTWSHDQRREILRETVQTLFLRSPVELSTFELVDLIYPEKLAHGEATTRRRLLFKDLELLQDTTLAGYNHKGALEKNAFGQMVHRRRWHAYRASEHEIDWQARALAAEARLLEMGEVTP